MEQDRRRYPRVGVALDFAAKAGDTEWRGQTIDLSPYGAKVALPPNVVTLPPGTSVELQLGLPDGDSPLSLRARVVRTDADGIAFSFLHLGALAFARLKDLADSVLHSLSNSPVCLDVSVGPLRDRRRAPRAAAQLDINLDTEPPRYWQGKYKTINLSTIGVKVAWPATAGQPPWGTGVQLFLAGPDGQRPLSVKGLVWRREPQSVAFLFIELKPEQRERLEVLVESLRAAFASVSASLDTGLRAL